MCSTQAVSVCMHVCIRMSYEYIHPYIHCYSSLTYALHFELRLGCKPLHLSLFYRPPTMSHHLSVLQAALECVPPTLMKKCILLGDFNVNPSPSLLSDLTAARSSFHLSQMFYRTYKNHRHCYNINWSCMCMLPTLHQLSPALPLLPYSAVTIYAICIWLKYRSPPLRALLRRVWKYNAADFEGANEALLSTLPN